MLLATTVTGLWGWHEERKRVWMLEWQVADLQKQEQRSAVLRSISKQMETIAYQQKDISDEQREEALQQKHMADEMRQRSEVERMNALKAQRNAIVSEHRALEAQQAAESQRQMAEHERIQAELQKRTTDTLSYIALGRSLGSLSAIQMQLGNTELADLLAYASYHFVSRYRGDVLYPAIFQSLMSASQSKLSWARHKGALMGMAYMPHGDNRIVTVSNYGEIMIHQKLSEQMMTVTLFNNNKYDFRSVYVDQDKTIYAVSCTGQLVIVREGSIRVVPLDDLDFPMMITAIDDDMLITGKHGLAIYDKQRKQITATRELDFNVMVSSRYKGMPMLFDDQGRQHTVKNINELITTQTPITGHVTAFASSDKTKMSVYGMSDGTIYLMDESRGKVTKLQGHLSRISKLKLNGPGLYSASYDGTVRFWNTSSAKIEATTLLSAGSWIMDFTLDGTKQYIWIGEQDGSMTQALLSVEQMASIIKNELKRDFTNEEWNYYIGRNVPYESFLKEGKEVEP